VSVPPAVRFCIATWLPRSLTSTNPWVCKISQTWRPERTLSRTTAGFEMGDVHLALPTVGYLGRVRALEEQFDGLAKIVCRLFDGLSLARYVEFRA
jgi:hypothetical protein